ncbi:MAG: DsrE family protein [Nitrospiraceae bacterium]|nr:DsrE family protein [Nitrospiraceae bacterium]
MGVLTIGCFASASGNMSYDFMLRLADAAARKGHKVNIWFSGNAVSSVQSKQKHLKDYSTAEKYLKTLVEQGVKICTCEACSVARGLRMSDKIEGIEWNTMYWFLAKIHEADRVLQIGEE